MKHVLYPIHRRFEPKWPALLAVAVLPLAAGSVRAESGTTAAPAAPMVGATDATPAAGTPAPGAPADPAAPASPAAAKPKKPPQPVDVLLVPSYQTQNLSGNRGDYYHYHRPPTGLYFGLLQALRRDAEGFPLQEIWWRNPGMSDEKGYLDAHLRNQPTFVRFWRTTSDFSADPRLVGFPFSRREDTRAQLHVEKMGPHPAIDFYLWDQKLNEPALGRYLPFRGAEYQATRVGFTSVLSLLGGQLYLDPQHLTFDNHIGRLPGSDTTWLTGEFVRPIGDRADASAAYDRITTSFSGRESATWNVVRLQGNVQASDRVFVDGFFRHQDADLPFTRTDYANQRDFFGVNVTSYPFPHGSLRGGIFREGIQRVERVDGDTERTAWTGGWAQLRASDPGRWNLNLRFREKDLDRAPEADIVGLPTSDTLYYTHDHSLDARLDLFPAPRLSTYLLYGWRERDNGDRDTRLTLNTATIGATAVASPRLTLSAEYTAQLWDGNTRPFRFGGGFPPPGNLPPRLFYSDGQIVTATASYELTRLSTLDLSINHFRSTGGQAARDVLATLEYRHTVNRDFFYSAGYQFESFHDSRLSHGYTAFPLLFQVGYRREFR